MEALNGSELPKKAKMIQHRAKEWFSKSQMTQNGASEWSSDARFILKPLPAPFLSSSLPLLGNCKQFPERQMGGGKESFAQWLRRRNPSGFSFSKETQVRRRFGDYFGPFLNRESGATALRGLSTNPVKTGGKRGERDSPCRGSSILSSGVRIYSLNALEWG